MTQKVLIFDSGALISLAMSGLIGEIRNLKKIFDGKFMITRSVKGEVIDKPLTIKRFELEAMMIQQLLDDKILEAPSSLGIGDGEIMEETRKILDASNNIFYTRKRPVHLIDVGEASCLALSRILSGKKIENIIAIDERTTRMLGEKPDNLKKLMESKLHMPIFEKKDDYKFFRGFKFIRSTELVYVAYKKNLIPIKNKNLLDALLYALKSNGAAISEDEIAEIKRIG
ncbi:hypothetical protein HY449_00840 [Candidatus Pacearchaeota archaeon]|nr:hypothetical protein [Candidatus Pacearchaeota archaeon]